METKNADIPLVIDIHKLHLESQRVASDLYNSSLIVSDIRYRLEQTRAKLERTKAETYTALKSSLAKTTETQLAHEVNLSPTVIEITNTIQMLRYEQDDAVAFHNAVDAKRKEIANLIVLKRMNYYASCEDEAKQIEEA